MRDGAFGAHLVLSFSSRKKKEHAPDYCNILLFIFYWARGCVESVISRSGATRNLLWRTRKEDFSLCSK
ncbi:MAG: hypothetical protein B7Z63_01815 [Ignavibacteriae bacterium 37-53-5]|nr:MAG: hypothetical protein B7Z63_01815 [Ignavibacteriae bacterium 37-53-5]